jgi:hypothetical protein
MARGQGKRRSYSQRIGETGEDIFRLWATKNGLIAQKVERDYGIDFYCQTTSPINRRTDEVTGGVLAAQVRSVAGGRRPRVKLRRKDVQNALRVEVPFCLFAVDAHAEEVSFLFLERAHTKHFHEFLQTRDQTTSIPLAQFHRGSDNFKRELAYICRSGHQQQLRILKTELGVAQAMPGSTLTLLHTSGRGLARIELPWITQALDVPTDHQQTIATALFEEGSLTPAHLNSSGIRIREEIRSVAELADGPVLLSGDIEKEVTVVLEAEGRVVSEPFLVRHIGDEMAFVHAESGLVLVMSEPRKRGKQYYHDMGIRLTKKGAKPLGELRSKIFLQCLRAGTVVRSGLPRVSLSQWPMLEQLGPSIDTLDLMRERLGLDTSTVLLADFKDEEFDTTLRLLQLLLIGVGVEQIVPGFVLGPAAGKRPKNENWMPAGFRFPIVANFKGTGIVVWVEGTGELYLARDFFCGFRPRQQSKWDLETRPTPFKKSPTPEAWITRDWPAIPLFVYAKATAVSFEAPCDHPFGGRIWPLLCNPEDENSGA